MVWWRGSGGCVRRAALREPSYKFGFSQTTVFLPYFLPVNTVTGGAAGKYQKAGNAHARAADAAGCDSRKQQKAPAEGRGFSKNAGASFR